MNQFCILETLSVVFLVDSIISLQYVDINKRLETLVPLLKKHGESVVIQPDYLVNYKDNRNGIEKSYATSHEETVDDYLSKNKRFHKPGKKVLIKRILPHGLPPSKLEFDSKYKTIYRPLVRVHKRKSVPKIGTILNIDGTTNGLDKYGIDFYDYFDNDENVLKFAINRDSNKKFKQFKLKKAYKSSDVDEVLQQPFNENFTNRESPDEVMARLILLKEIQKLLRNIVSRPKRKIYRDIAKVLDEISDLRTNEKSGEDNDPMAPGKVVHLDNGYVEEGPSKPKKWLTHYAPWNFWTYKKTIYQDVCPAGQVKIANLCIWLPPH